MRMKAREATPPYLNSIQERKRAVNLTLSESVVEEARHYTTNLSATVEELLQTYVAQHHHAHVSRQQSAQACAIEWNALHDRVGSFADEHSTL